MSSFINIDLESSLLSALLNNKDFCDNQIMKINDNYFSLPTHKALFGVVYNHFVEYYGLLTEEILISVMKDNLVHESKIEEYVLLYNTLKSKNVLESSALFSIDQLRNLYLKRETFNLINESMGDIKIKNGEDLVNFLEEKLMDIKEIGNVAEVEGGFIYEYAEKDLETYEREVKNPNGLQGVPYGITELDEHTSGLHKGELGLITGGPGGGKSRLLFNIGAKAASKGYGIMYITLEMPGKQVRTMYYSHKIDLSYNEIKQRKMPDDKLSQYKSWLSNPPAEKFYVTDMPSGCTPQIIRHEIKKFKKLHSIDMVIVDYMQLVDGTKKYTSGWEKEVDIAKQFKQIARAEDVALLTAAQVNKEGRKGKKTGMEYISGGDLAPHCDIILQLKAQTPDQIAEHMLEAEIVKYRDGGPRTFVFYVNWDKNFIGDKQLLLNAMDTGFSVANINNTPVPENTPTPTANTDVAGTLPEEPPF